MKHIYFIIFLAKIFLFTLSTTAQNLSEPKTLGVGLAYSFPAYGVSAKYNITETHAAQIILGGASYGFGTNSFAATGRYSYNFQEKGDDFIFRPYVYGQVGYNTVRFNFIFENETFTTISFGAGGGVEFTFKDFIEGLYFAAELGYIGGSFNNNFSSSFAGFAWGGGVFYRFNI